jgi:hypothetical protein
MMLLEGAYPLTNDHFQLLAHCSKTSPDFLGQNQLSTSGVGLGERDHDHGHDRFQRVDPKV